MGTVNVEVDPAALTSEADANLAAVGEGPAVAPGSADPAGSTSSPGAPGTPPIAGELSPDQILAIAERNAPSLIALLDAAAMRYAPNWQLTDPEIGGIGQAAAVAMAAWLPSGVIPFKWVALANLGGALYQVVKLRRDPKTGELKPLRVEPPATPARGARDGTAAAA